MSITLQTFLRLLYLSCLHCFCLPGKLFLIPQHPGQMPSPLRPFLTFSGLYTLCLPGQSFLPPASSGYHAFALVSHTIRTSLLPWGRVVLFLPIFRPHFPGPRWTPEDLCFPQTLLSWDLAPLRYLSGHTTAQKHPMALCPSLVKPCLFITVQPASQNGFPK